MSPSPQNAIHVVIEQLEPRTIEMRRQPTLGDRHADAVGNALAERPGGGLDARGQAVFRMAGSLAAELAEILDLIQRHCRLAEDFALGTDCLDAGQMKQGIEQHGSVSVGEHETVAVWPDRVFRVVAQKLLPQTVGDRGQRHRCARMAGIRLLHGVHRKSADGVDTQLIELRTGGGDRLVTDCH